MAEQAELIQQQMDETRSNLADKLGQLSQQITGTVEKVSEQVEDTVEAVSDTVEAVAETTQDTVHAVQEAFNLPKHIQNYPWLWFGGSLVLGFLGGRMLLGGSRREARDDEHDHFDLRMPSSFDTTPPRSDVADTSGWDASSLEEAAQPTSQTAGDSRRREESSQEGSESWLGSLTEKFGPQIDTLKQLALGSVFGVVRDMVAQAVPESMKRDLAGVIDEMTESAGGKPIKGPVIETSDNQDQDESEDESTEGEGTTGESRQRDDRGQSSSQRRDQSHDRPRQPTERQGQSAGQNKKRR